MAVLLYVLAKDDASWSPRFPSIVMIRVSPCHTPTKQLWREVPVRHLKGLPYPIAPFVDRRSAPFEPLGDGSAGLTPCGSEPFTPFGNGRTDRLSR